MASALQELRKAAGFKNADEFAAEMDIVPSTYKRYEQSPEKIPTKQAWDLANRLETSIDIIVGRSPLTEENGSGSIQNYFNSLSDEYKQMLLDYIDFMNTRMDKEKKIAKSKEEKQYEEYARYYERMFMNNAIGEGIDFEIGFYTPAERRELVLDFINERALMKREEEVGEFEADYFSSMMTVEPLYEDDPSDNPVLITYDEPEAIEAFSNEAKIKAAEFRKEKEEKDEITIRKIMEAYDRLHPELEGDVTYNVVQFPDE